MGLKRKRSSDYGYTYSPPSSTASFSSPPPAPNSWFSPIAAKSEYSNTQMELDFPTSKAVRPMGDLCAGDSGRTRKRWRDDRPDESVVHENTFAKLFAAQKAPHHSPSPPPTSQTQHQAVIAPPAQKSTLHAFWTIRQPQPIFTIPTPPEEALGTRCEDCDRSLASEGAMDVDVASIMGDDLACQSCGRRVCDFCAVNTDARRCIECVQEGRG